jgi:hypothetical protein
MTIWLLAFLLVASLAGVGYRQGAIRVAFSFLGIVVGALVAAPLGRFAGKVLIPLGIKDPLLVWALGPIIVFIVISAIFKGGALAVHQKVDVYFKYHAGDLRLALWERLNRRVGLCLGLLNGTAYAILLAFLIYVPSYATTQIASSDGDPKWLRILNTLGHDLHSSGMDKVARSIDSVPQINYEMADLGALIYRNPLAQARLSSYPPFLALAEIPEFLTLGSDLEFTKSWQRQDPLMALLENGNLQIIRHNPELLKLVWNTTEPNLSDLRTYLATGRSPKYDPVKILGRWRFDVGAAVAAMRRAKPNISSVEMQKMRRYLEAAYNKTRLVARPDNQVTLTDVPGLEPANPGASPGLQTLKGQWKDLDTRYMLSFSGLDLPATVEGDRLTIKSRGMDLVFNPEE